MFSSSLPPSSTYSLELDIHTARGPEEHLITLHLHLAKTRVGSKFLQLCHSAYLSGHIRSTDYVFTLTASASDIVVITIDSRAWTISWILVLGSNPGLVSNHINISFSVSWICTCLRGQFSCSAWVELTVWLYEFGTEHSLPSGSELVPLNWLSNDFVL